MSLKRIEDWDDILEPLQLPLNKPAEPFIKLNRVTTSEAALNGENWHDNMLKLVASWVAKGNTDEEIDVLAGRLTLPGYTIEQTLKDVRPMVDSARQRNPATKFVHRPSQPNLFNESFTYWTKRNQAH